MKTTAKTTAPKTTTATAKPETSFDAIRGLFVSNPTRTITAFDVIDIGVPVTSARTMLFHLNARGEIKKVDRGGYRADALARGFQPPKGK